MANTNNGDGKSTAAIALGGIGAALGMILGVGIAGPPVAFGSAIVGTIVGTILGAWLERTA